VAGGAAPGRPFLLPLRLLCQLCLLLRLLLRLPPPRLLLCLLRLLLRLLPQCSPPAAREAPRACAACRPPQHSATAPRPPQQSR
jgi:hypothetical protein